MFLSTKNRKYVASTSQHYQCCEENEHNSIEDALCCMLKKESNTYLVKVSAIDWAFGLRALVPTVPIEWHELVRCQKKYAALV